MILGNYARRSGLGYVSAKEFTRSARKAGLSVRRYAEQFWNVEGSNAEVLKRMRDNGCFDDCDSVCEIGPGTGMFLEPVWAEARPTSYEIYETARDWRCWLAKTYDVFPAEADGRSLDQTSSESRDLTHAHGVFIYLPALNTFEYLVEMIRVTAPGGIVVFDFCPSETFALDDVSNWLKTDDRFLVLLPSVTIIELFSQRGCELIDDFFQLVRDQRFRYLFFRKTTSTEADDNVVHTGSHS